MRPRLLDTTLQIQSFSSDPSWISERIDSFVRSYEQAVLNEFKTLPEDVQSSFQYGFVKSRSKTNDQNEADANAYESWYYLKMRPAYYCAGYRDPAEMIFRRIRRSKLLGRTIDLHELFLEKTANLKSLLPDGLYEEVVASIASIGGFCPRFQAGTKKLSNHAFGLAIDVDAVVNPDFNRREEIEVIRKITGYDLGTALTEFQPGVTPEQRVIEIHRRMQDASDKLKQWLNTHVSSQDPGVSPLTGRSEETPEDLLRILLKYRSAKDLNAWQRRGIQTVPVAFSAAMARLGFRWGNEYQNKKDVMHFELEGALQPSMDDHGQPYRPVTLEDLFDPFSDPFTGKRASPRRKR